MKVGRISDAPSNTERSSSSPSSQNKKALKVEHKLLFSGPNPTICQPN